MNCGLTAPCAQRVARVVSVRAAAPLRNVTRAVTVWRAAPPRESGTATVTRRWLERTRTVRTRWPLTENVTCRICRPETVMLAVREAQECCARTAAVADAASVPATAEAGVVVVAGMLPAAGGTAAGGVAGGAAAGHVSVCEASTGPGSGRALPSEVSFAAHHEYAWTVCVSFSVYGTVWLPPTLPWNVVVPSWNVAPSTVTRQWTVLLPFLKSVQVNCAPVQDTVAAGVCASAERREHQAEKHEHSDSSQPSEHGIAGSAAYHVRPFLSLCRADIPLVCGPDLSDARTPAPARSRNRQRRKRNGRGRQGRVRRRLT